MISKRLKFASDRVSPSPSLRRRLALVSISLHSTRTSVTCNSTNRHQPKFLRVRLYNNRFDIQNRASKNLPRIFYHPVHNVQYTLEMRPVNGFSTGFAKYLKNRRTLEHFCCWRARVYTSPRTKGFSFSFSRFHRLFSSSSLNRRLDFVTPRANKGIVAVKRNIIGEEKERREIVDGGEVEETERGRMVMVEER